MRNNKARLYVNYIIYSLFLSTNFLCYNSFMEKLDLNEVTALVAEKKYEEAKEKLAGIDNNENNLEALKLLGLCNINLENFDEARSNYETIVKYFPEDATSWFYLGCCYDAAEDYLHAQSAYEEVIKLREDYIEAYKCLCVNYVKTHEEDKAIEMGKKVLEKVQDDYTIYYIIGTAYMSTKRFEESVCYLEKALELKPDHAQLYNNLGTSYITIGNLDKAYENFHKATELDPNNAITYFNIGSICQMKNDHEKACEYFGKAYALEENDSFLTALALSEVKLQKWSDAIKHYKILILHHPEKQTYQYNLACCFEEKGEYPYAIGILAKLVALNPKSVSMSKKLANLFLKVNRPVQAKEIYERLIIQGTVSYETYYEFANICILTDDTDKAEKILKKVVELKPEFAQAHKDLGVIYLNRRLFDYAKDEFEKALQYAPEEADILYEYANYLHATTDFQKADEYYQKALAILPDNGDILAFSALNKMHTGDLDKALEQINAAIGKSVQSAFLLHIAGKIRYLMKNYEDAKMFLIKSFELKQNPEVQNLLGLTYFELGDYNQAKNIFKNILGKKPLNPYIMINIAKCDVKLNDKDSALETLEKVTENFPDNEEAHEMIRALS